MMQLYSYWRSTTSYRVRIALNLKGLSYDPVPVDLLRGEQREASYARLNPCRGVPTLVVDDATVLTQSMAILEWLEEAYPSPPLLPSNPLERARVRAASLAIATDIHPVNNLRVVNALKELGHDQATTVGWMCAWMSDGLAAFAALIAPEGDFCFGKQPGMADLCLVPQLYNARRWGLDLSPYPRLTQIEARCLALPVFEAAAPENQPDAPVSSGL